VQQRAHASSREREGEEEGEEGREKEINALASEENAHPAARN